MKLIPIILDRNSLICCSKIKIEVCKKLAAISLFIPLQRPPVSENHKRRQILDYTGNNALEKKNNSRKLYQTMTYLLGGLLILK